MDGFFPVDEAVVYYTNRTDGETNAAYMRRLCDKHPELRRQLEEILAPSVELEKRLDEGLPAPDPECEFFFGLDSGLNGEKQPLWSMAMLINGYYAGLKRAVSDADELAISRLSLSPEDKDRLFLSYLYDLGVESAKGLLPRVGEAGLVLEAIAASGLNSLTRIKLTELYTRFELHIKRLAEILRPAVEIIKSSADLCEKAVSAQLKRIEAAGDLAAYMIKNHGFELAAGGGHIAHINVLAPHTVNIRDGIFPEMDVYIGVGVTELAALLYSGRDSERLAAVFKLLSDETRLEMLKAISVRPMYGQELAEAFDVTAPTVSYHMTKLVMSGLAESCFDGGKSYFKANAQSLADIERSFEKYFLLDGEK